MRIRAAGAAAALTCSLALTGCGGGADSPAETQKAETPKGELLIWADDKRAAALQPFAEKFGAENGVTVKVQAISKDQQTTFVTASQQGSGPDVTVGAHDWIGNLVQNGIVTLMTAAVADA
jgi:arabinogalactan oligomer/maltooligosaccharide transport system substrate-binding protein